MSILRWILLAAGAVLVAGLWWWERRRGAVPLQNADMRTVERFEPRLGGETATETAPVELPTLRALPEERTVPRGDPPLVTIEDLPENAEDVVFAASARDSAAAAPAGSHAGATQTATAEAGSTRSMAGTPLPRRSRASDVQSEERRPAGVPPSTHQKLAALRLVPRGTGAVAGALLRAALEEEGLQFGRYSIYHRQRADGRAIFSVASLVEPGSFDLTRIDEQRFPGISLFAVFPGPLPAPEAFDDMLAAARRLAERLGAMLQDERGSSLTPQGALGIREELVHFEHVVAVSRDRTSV